MPKKQPQTLQNFIEKGHVRYMPNEIENELRISTPNCGENASRAERLFWILNKISEYPTCKACDKKLTSLQWCPSIKTEWRQYPGSKAGYRPFCGRTCAYTFENQKNIKMQNTSMARYGVEHPMRSPIVIETLRQANIRNTGEAWPMRWGSERFKAKLFENYGVTSIRDFGETHKNIIESISKKTTERLPFKIKELEELFNVKCLSDLSSIGQIYRIYDYEFKWKHSCGKIFSSNISERGIKVCPKCSNSGSSKAEKLIGDFIESFRIPIVRRDKKILNGLELDIWIPSLKIGIEFDGTYWHSADFVSKTKSMEKLILMEKLGFRLITIQEHLWYFQNEKTRSNLKSSLGIFDKRIFARKLLIKEVSKEVSNDFINNLHSQNTSKRATIFFGLFENETLISVATFGKPRFNKKADWELLRLSTIPNTTVVGGVSKLISAFRKKYDGPIVSYADRCWSQGNLYKKCDFTFISNNDPSYFWVSGKYGVYSRYQTQRKKLPLLLEKIDLEFDESLSEDGNMKKHKFLKVFDRGTSTWILE